MNLATILIDRAASHPDRPALIDHVRGRDRVVSYGEFARRVAAGAGCLRDAGLRRGQVILVFQPVSIELYEILLAAFHAGLRVMLADPSAGPAFLTSCCKRLPPDAFFGPWKAQCLRLAIPALRRIPLAFSSGGWFPATRKWNTGGERIPPADLVEDDVALVTFTSGSTGAPKAAARSHGFLLAQHRALSRALDFQEGETDLVTLPVFVLANLASGLTSVLAATDLAKPGKPDAAAVSAQCARFHVTRCAASPAFFEGLLGAAEPLPAFEKLFTGGAPVFPDLLRRLRQALPDATIHSVYGSTEAEPIAHFPADEADAETDKLTRRGAGLCAGTTVDEISLRIITDRWGTPLGPMTAAEFAGLLEPDGTAGEIVVSGDHVLGGYLDGIGDEETKIHAGGRIWHRTGDAGRIDQRGRLWLLGRCAGKLPAAGDAPCYPFAIECALREMFPGTRTAAVEWQGQRVLVVEKSAAAFEAAAAEFAISRVITLEKLPLDRRHNAKIDYLALRAALEKAGEAPKQGAVDSDPR